MKLCSIYKDIISFQLDSGKPLPGWLKSHCATCEECGSYRQKQSKLISQLTEGAEASAESPSPFLHGKIMSAIERSEHQIEPEEKSFSPVWSRLIGISTVVLIGFVLFRAFVTPDAHNPAPQVAATDGILNSTVFDTISFAKIQSFDELSVSFNTPLETEMQNAMADIQMAVDALSDTLLSESLKESLQFASRD